MNFDDDQQAPQRPIASSSGSLDEKIAGSPSPYPSSSARKRRSSEATDAAAAAAAAAAAGDEEEGEPVVVQPADVLCGRGKTSFNHAGNKRFRDIITECIPEYNQANSRLEKSLVVHSIVESVRGEGGRFLKEIQSTGEWYALDDRACRDKVGHAIRDAATTTETRRQKKLKHQSMPASMLSSRGPVSRYAEMKMDTPEPVSFHDVVHSSFRGRPMTFPTNSRPLGIQYSGMHAMGLPTATLATSTLPAFAGAFEGAGQSVIGAGRQSQALGDPTDEIIINSQPDEAGFMEEIDQVLGPMPPNHNVDPLADILDLS